MLPTHASGKVKVAKKMVSPMWLAPNWIKVCLLGLLLGQPAFGQSAIEGELKQSGDVMESRNPVTLITTGNILGLMTVDALRASGPGFSQNDRISFHVALDAPDVALCVRLKSRDEDYRGAVDYEATQANQGWHRIAFSTDHADYLSDLDQDEFLVGAFVGENCDELYPEKTSLVPVSLSDDNSDTFYVLANTRNNDAVIVSILDDGTEHVVDCETLSGEMSKSVFQRKCPVENRQATRLIVEADDGFGGLLWSETITIAWPSHAR